MNPLILPSFFALLSWPAASTGKTKDIDRHVVVQPSDKIELRGFSSSKIDFKSWDKNEVYVKLKVEIQSSNEEKEDDYLNSVELQSSRTDSTELINLQLPTLSGGKGFSWANLLHLRFTTYNSIEITGEIYLPSKNALVMEAKYCEVRLEDRIGDLSLVGSGSTFRLRNCRSIQRIDNDHGTTVIEQSGGSLTLSSSGSRVTVDRFDGAIDLNADYSTVQLRGIEKGARIRARSSSNVTVEHSGGDVSFAGGYSTLRFEDIKGFATIEDQEGVMTITGAQGMRINAPYAHITISSVMVKPKEALRIETIHGRIVLKNITGDVSIEGPFSPSDLTAIRGNVDITTTYTQVDLNDIVGDLSVKSEYTKLSFGSITSENVFISNKGSQIDFEPKTMPARIEIENEQGNATLRLDKNYSARMDLKATHGTIKCDLPLEVEQSGDVASYVGTIGTAGKNVLRVTTSSGDITLKIKSHWLDAIR